ncbi:class I SAM-dependent methyltransferase [Paenibacillus caui]|uniref:class I SAM-dependent methyltransferase n=1 Tax=Paenibacillus caui TaxID=2873927 RepID=UPI001CA902CE|nr:class I SAM-dependent methyltransferase [Paenibacillus caui]
MLDNKGFDNWAEKYEETIEANKGYPFDGYDDVLLFVQSLIPEDDKVQILDIGIGTGKLTHKLYQKGHTIFGLDFSEEMIRIARERMPEGRFFIGDFSGSLPEPLLTQRFRFIVSSYALHHVDDVRKIELIRELAGLLEQGGLLIVADIAFQTRQDLYECKRSAGDSWDRDEYYMTAEDMVPPLIRAGLNVEYVQKSSCAGVLLIRP